MTGDLDAATQAYVAQIVAAAPPLTPEQAALLRGTYGRYDRLDPAPAVPVPTAA